MSKPQDATPEALEAHQAAIEKAEAHGVKSAVYREIGANEQGATYRFKHGNHVVATFLDGNDQRLGTFEVRKIFLKDFDYYYELKQGESKDGGVLLATNLDGSKKFKEDNLKRADEDREKEEEASRS